MGLKDIRTRANHVYEKLDEWIVENTFNHNEALKEVRQTIRLVINQTTDQLSPDLKFRLKYIEGSEEINFISSEKPSLESMIRDKLSE